jgi:hypothetical protein
MRPKRPSRQFVYALTLAVILLSQQTISQTQSSSQPSTNPNAGSNAEANAGNLSCTNAAAYVLGPRSLL